MMLLLFTVGDERYGVDTSQVIEVLPFLKLKPIHRTPAYVAGIANCRGKLIPVLDISRIHTKKPARNLLSTRIILVKQTTSDATEHLMGILAEQVTDTLQLDASEATSLRIKEDKGNLLGEEFIINERIIQRVNINELLPSYLHQRIFNYEAS